MPNRIAQLGGQRFGRLVANRIVGRKYGRVCWECLCDCGTICVVTSGHLRQGTLSCGCARESPPSHGVHGECVDRTHTPEYAAWTSMKQRCDNPHATGFKYYGGRGISVCSRWRESFKNFLADMGRRPSARHSLDRIDNDGNYDAENCRWATKLTQMSNRRPQRSDTRRRGERSWNARVNTASVRIIRRCYEIGMKQIDLAPIFGIGNTTVSLIVRRKIWKHVIHEGSPDHPVSAPRTSVR